MKNFKYLIVISFCLSLTSVNINTVVASTVINATAGTIYCGGGYTKVTRSTVWVFRNYDPNTAITLTSMKFFDATGAVLYDSNINPAGIPPSTNGLLGGLNNILEANQSTLIRSKQLVSANLLPILTTNQRPIQLRVQWTAPQKVVGLEAALIVVANIKKSVEVSPGIFKIVSGRELGRHEYDCLNQKL